MELNPDPVHLTSAVTDVVLAIAAFLMVRRLWMVPRAGGIRRDFWLGAFSCVWAAATFGALRHGLGWAPVADDVLRALVNLSIGLGLALLGSGVTHDLLGERAARQAMPFLVVVATVIGIFLALDSRTFILLSVFGAAVFAAGSGAYLMHSLRETLPGARLILVGFLLTFVGAAVQAQETLRFTLIWRFDHDDFMHGLQAVALVVFTSGVLKGFETNSDR